MPLQKQCNFELVHWSYYQISAVTTALLAASVANPPAQATLNPHLRSPSIYTYI